MALNPMPRTTINQSHDMAAVYRNQYPLPSGPLIETYGLLRNTRLSLFRDIDTMRAATDQFIDPDVYLELAILGGETFLATSERLGVPQNLRRFVRYHELPQLKSLRGIEPDKHLFVEVMKRNTAWIASLLDVIRQLREARRAEELRG